MVAKIYPALMIFDVHLSFSFSCYPAYHLILFLDRNPERHVAGKLAALIDRKTGRVLFDADHLLTRKNLDMAKLRLALVIYSAISRKREISGH